MVGRARTFFQCVGRARTRTLPSFHPLPRWNVCDGKVGKGCPSRPHEDQVDGILKRSQILGIRNRRVCMKRLMYVCVLDDVKDEFKIGDDKAGLLQTVFVIAYMVCAPVFGYLGDRYSRRLIMALGVALWCCTTMAGSFMKTISTGAFGWPAARRTEVQCLRINCSKNYYWFAFFRCLVGVGEASYSTIAPTIISDLFVGNIRSKMLALFYFAIPVGSGLGYIVGSGAGAVAGNWRWGLRVTPFLGVAAVALIASMMRDPDRGHAEESHIKPTSYKEDIRSLIKNPSFILSTLAFTCVAFVTGALAWWGPQFIHLGLMLQSNSNASLNSVSSKFGLVGMFAGAVGVPLGSWLAQRLRARLPDSDPLVCAGGLLASVPLVYLSLVTVDVHVGLTYFLIFLGMVTLNLSWSIVADIVLVSYESALTVHRIASKLFFHFQHLMVR
ncbi:Protein spinster [Eumeta japonica]|uniref:Protein spinster n=1 Tax=Eumeta variegata TaxID=151549 RepID=A0A4C1VJZ4_EUMVA|nr:Protein spinster [Eumeta japonica]